MFDVMAAPVTNFATTKLKQYFLRLKKGTFKFRKLTNGYEHTLFYYSNILNIK